MSQVVVATPEGRLTTRDRLHAVSWLTDLWSRPRLGHRAIYLVGSLFHENRVVMISAPISTQQLQAGKEKSGDGQSTF